MSKNRSEDVWLDPETGLMWQTATSDNKIDWKDVGRYAEQLNQLNYGGYSDWRVPTVFELETLNTEKPYFIKGGPSSGIFIKEPLLHSMDFDRQSFWTSSQADEIDGNRARTFLVNFFYAKRKPHSESRSGYACYSKYVRCVRY
ncbi:Lcl C-terminal domain-containing protein [Proteus terrae]|uniref:Lcl C-terminal domain-containing protein n=1 Tax=Proteus terrae TaxID=1574161 RepID=UPI0013E0147B|nr:DUF1566 domain-containing protein [Proteus terrae]QIF99269.1 DUF1566 domain-containing protein [Proteus terrae subsp. cibarius]